MTPTLAPSPHKRTHGQFFTEGNPFVFAPFHTWFEGITPGPKKATLLEPFAGANHIVRLMREAGFDQKWACFDIDPPSPISQGVKVVKQDTLTKFPKGFEVVITNPPYLARNSAMRRGLAYPETPFDDLYKHALQVVLSNAPYVAAIIPESFIVSGEFIDRLQSTVSLTSKMFTDTDHPVCMALFVPAAEKKAPGDFLLWDEDALLGNYQKFSSVLAPVAPNDRVRWKFNDPQGNIGLRGIDDTKTASIRFVDGASISSSAIKHSSRALTRISGLPDGIDPKWFIDQLNHALLDYRAKTHDTLMTSFKGLRSDGKYRRRLDFAAARNLLDHCALASRNQPTKS